MDARWLLVMLAACGDNGAGPVPEVEPGCHKVPWTSHDRFSRSSDLGPVVGYTLEDFDASGRWFGQDIIIENLRLTKHGDGDYKIIDREELEASSSQLFATTYREDSRPVDGGPASRFTRRISNLREDGSLRYDEAFCEDKVCTVCTGSLVRAERHDPQPSDKLTLVGELLPMEWSAPKTIDVKVAGTTAFVMRGDGLWTVDVADPARPAVVGHYKDPKGSQSRNDVAVFDAAGARYAITAGKPAQILDVTNPADLRLVAQVPLEVHTVVTETRDGMTRAYFGGNDGQATAYDVTNPASPILLGAYSTGASFIHGMFVEDGIVYLSAWERGLFVVDFRASAEPKRIGYWRSPRQRSASTWMTKLGGRRVAVHGDETYSGRITVLDVEPGSTEFMKPLGYYQTREHVSPHNVTGVGTKAYFTHYQDGVRVVDLADPANPTLVGYYNTWDPADLTQVPFFFASASGLALDVSRKLIFVADLQRGLLILRDDT